MIRTCSLVCFLFIIASCDDQQVDPKDEAQYILEGYIYADRPIDKIKISKVNPTGNSVSSPVSDVIATITQGEQTINLSPNGACQNCFGSANIQDKLNLDTELIIHAEVNNYAFWAKTNFPPDITGVKTSENSVDLSVHVDTEPVIRISWDQIPGYHYVLFIKYVDESGLPIWSSPAPTIHSNPFQMIIHEEQAAIYAEHLSYYGNYEIYLTAVNADYEDFAANRMSGELASNYGNVHNANGIFTAFNGVTIPLTIK